MSVELWPKLLDVSILLQPSASILESPDPPMVRKVVFRMTLASMHSYFIFVWIVVYRWRKAVYHPHFEMGVFTLKG